LKSENILQRLNHLLLAKDKNLPFVDPNVFTSFYNQTCLAVFRYIFGLTGGPPAEVEDLTAETFMRAWKSRQAYQGDADRAIGWVLKIAHNLVIDSYRRNQSNASVIDDPLEEDTLPAPPEQHPEAQLIMSEQQLMAIHLLNTLSPEQREILTLHYLLNWKIKQISQFLNIPENTISVYNRRALEKLRSSWPVEKEL
jgi:RNA polymerase sigma-70 factor, ECF subfamily